MACEIGATHGQPSPRGPFRQRHAVRFLGRARPGAPVGTLAYVALVLLRHISGKRALSKLNAFDLVVTVALGSTLATVLLGKSVALAEGLPALGLLILLQYAIA